MYSFKHRDEDVYGRSSTSIEFSFCEHFLLFSAVFINSKADWKSFRVLMRTAQYAVITCEEATVTARLHSAKKHFMKQTRSFTCCKLWAEKQDAWKPNPKNTDSCRKCHASHPGCLKITVTLTLAKRLLPLLSLCRLYSSSLWHTFSTTSMNLRSLRRNTH